MNFAENLADKKKPWGYIRFTHKDGKVHEFYSCVNRLNGDRLSAFDNHARPIANLSSKFYYTKK